MLCCCPPVQLFGVSYASSTTISVLSEPLFQSVLSFFVLSRLFWCPRFPVLHFNQRPYASLLGPTLRPLLPLHVGVLVLYSFTFRPMVQRQLSWSNLADPDKSLRRCSLFFLVPGSFLLCLSTDGPMLGYFFASCLLLTVEPMAPRLLSMSNAACLTFV